MSRPRPLTATQRRMAAARRPPDGIPAAKCACGAVYLDYPDGHDAHDIVFGHQPRAPDPTTHPGDNNRNQ